MPTYQCTAECMHCGTLSSPREKTWLPSDLMLRAIDEAKERGHKLVVFTGGEPTLAGKELIKAISYARSLGLMTRVVTNAYWAVNNRAAKERMNSFVGAGLQEINFSTGDQHARFVPIERVIRATRVAVEAGLPVSVMVETVKERKITKTIIEDLAELKRIRQDFPNAHINIHESPWMPLSVYDAAEYPEGISVNASNVASCKGCDSVLSTTTIMADGTIGACCGLGMRLIPELHLGNIREMSLEKAETTADNDFLKRWIRIEGPERILAWAATHNPNIVWENLYAHRCQACLRIYKDREVREVTQNHHRKK
jgi:MoaA/NifB/PqqE/SkfB family radical SAM enzyme